MKVTIVQVQVKLSHLDDFIRATRTNHEASVQESGNLRFDVLQLAEDPTQFVLYEAYSSEQAAAAHKMTPHYLTWREQVANYMAKPRQGIQYLGLFPTQGTE